ncbi:hypothetical protein P7H17_15945 [Paenibacillus larvae]|nr:hypothetical protein [Paenibacillus larvae]MDT2287212.1 hypothetical protein [Paenibacillus larvae]
MVSTMPGFIMQSCFAVSEIRLRVGQFMDEIMKHPHAIIDRLCVRLLIAIFVQLI